MHLLHFLQHQWFLDFSLIKSKFSSKHYPTVKEKKICGTTAEHLANAVNNPCFTILVLIHRVLEPSTDTLCSHLEAGTEAQTDSIVQEGSARLCCLICSPLPLNFLLSSVELLCSS